jgi:DNA polymerase-3 subunit alpha
MATCLALLIFIKKLKITASSPLSAVKRIWPQAGQKAGHLAHNEYYHLILLATNQVGYHNLIKLSSKAYLEGFYYKPRMDKELLKEHHEGLIALSGCLSGEVPQLIGQHDLEGAMRVADEYRSIFGRDHYYLEVQANGLEQQQIANRGLM